jgi:predicted TIM-barrel fold metal-dependent hydrolase
LSSNIKERYMRSLILGHEVERSLSVLIFSGVLDRFPSLRIVSAENNCGWIPYFLQRMDGVFERSRYASGYDLRLKPSEYFQRQMYCTYIDDYVGVANRHFIGVDKLMWSSDYPHQASTWPHSQEVVARDFKDASEEDRFKITRGNVAKLYGFDL